MLIAAACHDHEHPGLNNAYLIESRHDYAVRYNDVSVLENHHVASSFALINQEKFNIFKNFEVDDYKKARKIMIGCILATDMSKHFGEQTKFKSRVASWDYDLKGNDKELSMHVSFHLADISNPTKQFDVFKKWTDLLFVEFFAQGDLERAQSVPITYLMDRTTVNIAKSQVGFIDFIVQPAYEILLGVIPLVEPNIRNIHENKQRWLQLVDEYEEKLNAEKIKTTAKINILSADSD